MSLGLELRPERAFMRRRSCVEVRSLPGFVRGRHRIPSEHGRSAEQFVHDLAEQALADEVREVYERAKRVLGLRRRELVRALAAGGGNVDAPQFQFALELGLDPQDPARALWQRRVVVLVGLPVLPVAFDELFPVGCDELVVPFDGAPTREGFDDLVDTLEDFAARWAGEVEEDEQHLRAELSTRDGSRIGVDLRSGELSLRFVGVTGCRALLLEAQRRHAELGEPILAALERPIHA